MKKLLLALLISLPFTVFGQDISGTGWKTYTEEGDELIILFESDGTFTYLNKVSFSGNEGNVFGDDDDAWMASSKDPSSIPLKFDVSASPDNNKQSIKSL